MRHRGMWGLGRSSAVIAGLALVGTLSACSSGVSTTNATPSGSTPGPSADAGAGTSSTTTPAEAKPVASKGCSTTTAAAEDKQKHTLAVDGADRWYLLTSPGAAVKDKPLPLVVDMHGLAEGADVHTAMSGFGDKAKKEGFLVVVPNGQGQPVHWDASTASNPNQDVDFLDQMLTQIESERCVDTSRVYATGLSYGAIMSSMLTCVRADTFAAVAPVAGLTIHKNCKPSRPMPVVTFHGTADPILKFNGGVDLSAIGPKTDGAAPTTVPADLNGPGYPQNVADWAARNGCQKTPKDTDVTPNVIHRVYDCPANAAVEFYIVKGGGHAWPGSEFSKSIGNVVGPTTFDINATDVIWDFFKRFSLPQK